MVSYCTCKIWWKTEKEREKWKGSIWIIHDLVFQIPSILQQPVWGLQYIYIKCWLFSGATDVKSLVRELFVIVVFCAVILPPHTQTHTHTQRSVIDELDFVLLLLLMSSINVKSLLIITIKYKHLTLLQVGRRFRSKSQTGQKECWDADKKDKKSGTWSD